MIPLTIGEDMEPVIAALLIFALLGLTVWLLERNGFSSYEEFLQYSRWECTQLGQEHEVKDGRCTICGQKA